MRAIQEEWEHYCKRVYPQGVDEVQIRECRQAFFAGGLTTCIAIQGAALLPDKEGVREIARIYGELIKEVGGMVQAAKRRVVENN
jgi:hypothetical protein